MKTIQIELKGISPLIMQSDTLADPLNPGTLELKEVSSKKTKTDADHRAIERIELRRALYFDEAVGVYVPDSNLLKCLIESARMTKEGKTVERGVQIAESEIPLIYDGAPKSIESLITDPRHKYRKTVVVGGRRVVRARPIFRDWSCRFSVVYDEAMVKNDSTVLRLWNNAGRYVGIGGRRIGKGGQFGRFEAKLA
jgi:hypothetical protein